jgi:hypothetical protein
MAAGFTTAHVLEKDKEICALAIKPPSITGIEV